MSRYLILILLLGTGLVLADEAPPAPDATAAPAAEEETARADSDPSGDGPAAAEEQEESTGGAKRISGMSILGNQEAPKSLVIVPWKSSAIGDSLSIATMLDDTKLPVDREVFIRALSYYEIRSEATP